MGLADLTGELMRNAINALGAGNMEVCFVLLEILQSMAEGFGQVLYIDFLLVDTVNNCFWLVRCPRQTRREISDKSCGR